jgi:hypothetical protein
MKSDLPSNNQNQSLPLDPLLTAEDTAKLLNVALITLAVWRSTKFAGPPYVKVGKNVRYQLGAIRQYIEKNTVSSEGLEND